MLNIYLIRKYKCFYHQCFSSWRKLALSLSNFDIISKAVQLYHIEIMKSVQKTLLKTTKITFSSIAAVLTKIRFFCGFDQIC